MAYRKRWPAPVEAATFEQVVNGSVSIPAASAALAVTTLSVSMSVSYVVNGTLLSKVPIVELAGRGGVRLTGFDVADSWRVLTAQLVHVMWPHMLYNVVCLFAVGAIIEHHIGAFRTVLVWVMAGGSATFVSPVNTEAPFDVATGASQAVLAFVGCAVVLLIMGRLRATRLRVGVLAVALIPAFGADLVVAGHLKIGHIVGLAGGAVLGVLFTRSLPRP